MEDMQRKKINVRRTFIKEETTQVLRYNHNNYFEYISILIKVEKIIYQIIDLINQFRLYF